MKKVLIIGFFYPYREGGSGRIIGLAKYLPEFGWQPIILTAPLNKTPDLQFKVIEVPFHDSFTSITGFLKRCFSKILFENNSYISAGIQRKEQVVSVSEKLHVSRIYMTLYNLYATIFFYPDYAKNWQSSAIKAGSELLQHEHIDVIISNHPITSHLVADKLKNKYKIPWIADFPDLWSQNHNYEYCYLRKLIDRELELKTLSQADVLTTVSQPWAEELRTLHRQKSIYAITHGFDPDMINVPPANLTSKFTITYTGSIYKGRQDPSKLFDALHDLILDGIIDPRDVEVRFYGDKERWLAKEIEKYGLSGIVKLYERVPKRVIFEKQRESQILLLFNWEDQQGRGWHSLKIYDYIAASRPILATGGLYNNVIKEILDETKTGIYCKEVDDIKNALEELYLQYKLKGKAIYKGDIEKINKYSQLEMTRKFAEILNTVKDKKV